MATKATILIVHKEKILVDLLIRSLSSPELTVVGTTSAEEGARLVDLYSPDLLLIDPSTDGGPQLVASVRSAPFKAKVVTVERDAGLDALIAAIRAQLPSNLTVLGEDNRIRVLICDDEDELRTVLSEYLKARGFAVTLARNGREAIERVQKDPDLQILLLDVSMPVMGGMEALSEIMNLDPHPNVVMMTAVADREIARQAMKSGAFDYVLKPFDFALIEASITACLSHSEYRKQPWWKRLTRS